MYKDYFYYCRTISVSFYGEIRDDCGNLPINDDANQSVPNLKLKDFGLTVDSIKKEVDGDNSYRNGEGFAYELHRVTTCFKDETEQIVLDEKDEIVDTVEYYKDLPYFYLRRYLDGNDDTIAEVKTESEEAPDEEEARKEAGVESDAFSVVVVKTYEGADKDEEEQVGSDYYPIDKKKKREEIISELRKVADQLSKTRYDLDDLATEADEVDEELGKKLTRAYSTAEELLKTLDDID